MKGVVLIIIILLITFHFLDGKLIKVLDFYGKGTLKTGEEGFDFVQLDNGVGRNLPSRFTICLSHFQEKFQADKILQFLRQDGQPWFYIYLYTFNQDEIGTVQFWMELEGEFLNFGSLEGNVLYCSFLFL